MNIQKTILITRPSQDNALRYLFFWSKKIIEFAQKKNFKVVDLKNERANREEFTKIVNKLKPNLTILNGHGDYDRVTGHDMKTIAKADENPEILSETITYAISCRSAKKLGPEVVKNGNNSYIGYMEDFIFYYDHQKVNNPLKDEKAKLFLEPSNQINISLLKNQTSEKSTINSKKYIIKNIQKLLNTDNNNPETSQLISALYWNFNNLVCLGNKEAVI